MAEDLHSDELLARYLDDEMLPAEKKTFEDLLASDPALQERLEGLRVARDSVRYYGLQQQVGEVRKMWEQTHQPAQTKDARVISMRKTLRYMLVAASIIIVIIGVRSFFMPPVTPEKIYRQIYIEYDPGDVRGAVSNHSPIEKAYHAQNYPEVIRLGSQSSLPAKDQLLLGIACLHLNDPSSAILHLQGLQQQADPVYGQDAEFYLALAYLKNKEYDKALKLLTKIRHDPQHLYHNQVRKKNISEIEDLH